MTRYFNPRSPGGERLRRSFYEITSKTFQSALPRWGASRSGAKWLMAQTISIRAPQVGSVMIRMSFTMTARHFNPRSPGGERHGSNWHDVQRSYFNPRSPGGERRNLLSCCIVR